MKHKHVTFSMATPLHQQLRVFVGIKNMSRFVSEAIREKLFKEQNRLKHSYVEAEKDRSRKKAIGDWSATEGADWP